MGNHAMENKRKYKEPMLADYGSLLEQTQGTGDGGWDFDGNNNTCITGNNHESFAACMSAGAT
jgi:hypothetical protein